MWNGLIPIKAAAMFLFLLLESKWHISSSFVITDRGNCDRTIISIVLYIQMCIFDREEELRYKRLGPLFGSCVLNINPHKWTEEKCNSVKEMLETQRNKSWRLWMPAERGQSGERVWLYTARLLPPFYSDSFYLSSLVGIFLKPQFSAIICDLLRLPVGPIPGISWQEIVSVPNNLLILKKTPHEVPSNMFSN